MKKLVSLQISKANISEGLYFCFDKIYIQIVSLARTMRLRDAFWMPLG